MFKSQLKSKFDEDISILITPQNHGYHYLCECGDASELTVKEIQNVSAIFISHTHIDHFVNFDAVVRHQIGIERRVVICGPKGIASQVQARIKSYTWNLIAKGAIVYEIRELLEDKRLAIYELEPPLWELKSLGIVDGNVLYEEPKFSVTGILLDHKVPSMAYKFQETDTLKINIEASGFKGGKWVKTLKDAFEAQHEDVAIEIEGQTLKAKDLFYLLHIQKGHTLGVILDHAAHAENHTKIKTHFNNCDTVYIESFYKNEDKELADVNFHSYAEMSGQIMKQCAVKQAIPVHFSRKYKDSEVATLIEEFEMAYKPISVH